MSPTVHNIPNMFLHVIHVICIIKKMQKGINFFLQKNDIKDKLLSCLGIHHFFFFLLGKLMTSESIGILCIICLQEQNILLYQYITLLPTGLLPFAKSAKP